ELTPEQRAVFVMYELEELSCAEIATELAIPKGTVFSRLHAAREVFKAAYTRGERDSSSQLVVGGSS
ncbi:MAG TPA: sigma factor-like helix-turn-helix DNA-binding protein, partial [Polyangiaceae bacterium]